MPRHNFNCGKCNESNTIDVSPQCGCHECEARRPANNYYRTMVNLIRCATIGVCVGLMLVPSGCWINNHFESEKAAAKAKADAEAATAQKTVEMNQKTAQAEWEVKRLEALKNLKLDQYDIKPVVTKDGKVEVTLTPRTAQ